MAADLPAVISNRAHRNNRLPCAAQLCVAELLQSRPGDAIHGPLTHRHRAEALVELDRALIPIEHRPFEPTAVALDRDSRQTTQQLLAVAAATILLTDIQSLRDRCRAWPGRSRSCGSTARSRDLPPGSRPMITSAVGFGPNRCSCSCSSVAVTSCSSRSNSASSRINCRIIGTSAGVAGSMCKLVMAPLPLSLRMPRRTSYLCIIK